MPELSESTDRATQWTEANKKALHFMLGAQRMMLEEAVFAAYATLDRVRTETHLFGEFASKLGAAHSVQDWKTMGSECGATAIGCSSMASDGSRRPQTC